MSESVIICSTDLNFDWWLCIAWNKHSLGLQENEIGQNHALFYMAYAAFMELRGNFGKAEAVFEMGLDRWGLSPAKIRLHRWSHVHQSCIRGSHDMAFYDSCLSLQDGKANPQTACKAQRFPGENGKCFSLCPLGTALDLFVRSLHLIYLLAYQQQPMTRVVHIAMRITEYYSQIGPFNQATTFTVLGCSTLTWMLTAGDFIFCRIAERSGKLKKALPLLQSCLNLKGLCWAFWRGAQRQHALLVCISSLLSAAFLRTIEIIITAWQNSPVSLQLQGSFFGTAYCAHRSTKSCGKLLKMSLLSCITLPTVHDTGQGLQSQTYLGNVNTWK